MSSQASTEAFSYDPLDDTVSTIRTLTIQPGGQNTPIHCTLSNRPIADDTYICLSYAWGEPLPESTIFVNGLPFLVRYNLHQFLLHARRLYVDRDLDLPLWIDAICINQSDLRERNAQVQMMADIYSRASFVVIYPGEVAEAVRDYIVELLLLDDTNDLTHYRLLREDFLCNHGLAYLDCLALPYYSRLWILPELVLPKRKYIVLAGALVSWLRFERFSRGAFNFIHDWTTPLATLPPVRNNDSSSIDQVPDSSVHSSHARSALLSMLNTVPPHEDHHRPNESAPTYQALVEKLSGRLQPFLDIVELTNTNKHTRFLDFTRAAEITRVRPCADIRDRVYAIRSLLYNGDDIAVDYSIDNIELFHRVLNFTALHHRSDTLETSLMDHILEGLDLVGFPICSKCARSESWSPLAAACLLRALRKGTGSLLTRLSMRSLVPYNPFDSRERDVPHKSWFTNDARDDRQYTDPFVLAVYPTLEAEREGGLYSDGCGYDCAICKSSRTFRSSHRVFSMKIDRTGPNRFWCVRKSSS